ncbi:hypothetical protein [Duganella vulcania]|uniref:Uncharacterized protein n=1 Tax=Duganella vulcania TaxID=2692166 RepID=A0A845GPA6_9BURK|nr:hypothetical protein [Duganella vulcania]MYM94459.1 hypothetical protein [Duganella vulcania]
MQISNQDVDDAALKAVGHDAVRLLCSGDITTLASRFGYATALGREPAAAIQEDLKECLEQIGASGLAYKLELGYEVKFFAPNAPNLFALVECVIPVKHVSGGVLVEVIVTSNGTDKYATLEQISVA